MFANETLRLINTEIKNYHTFIADYYLIVPKKELKNKNTINTKNISKEINKILYKTPDAFFDEISGIELTEYQLILIEASREKTTKCCNKKDCQGIKLCTNQSYPIKKIFTSKEIIKLKNILQNHQDNARSLTCS